MTADKIYIYGKHALMEALSHTPKSIERVFLASNFKDAELEAELKKVGIKTALLGSGKISREIESSAVHQGIIAQISLKNLMRSYEQFADTLEVTPNTVLVLLDELNDPHNVGAIIRSSAAFGVSGVLIPEHNQAPVTGAVVKVSAGMAFRIPLVTVANVNTVVRDLKKRGFWVYGLAGEEGAEPLVGEKFDAPTLLILGNESKGIRQKTRELCDILLSIPMNQKCESLNVAASAAVALYAWSLKHPGALK